MLFAAAAVVGGILATFALDQDAFVDSMTFHFARSVAYNIINIYAAKVAGAFLISTSTLAIYTGVAPRWIALIGYALAIFLLLEASTSTGFSSFSHCGFFCSASIFCLRIF